MRNEQIGAQLSKRRTKTVPLRTVVGCLINNKKWENASLKKGQASGGPRRKLTYKGKLANSAGEGATHFLKREPGKRNPATNRKGVDRLTEPKTYRKGALLGRSDKRLLKVWHDQIWGL